MDSISVGRVQSDRSTNTVAFSNEISDVDLNTGPVLIIDSAVHSGRTMLQVIDALSKSGAQDIASYSLVVKQGANLIPNYFGVLIDDSDRAYFQLKSIPNNRLLKEGPFGILRKLSVSDVDRVIESIEAPFTGLTTGDLLYDRETKQYQTYVYEEAGKLQGFLSFVRKGQILFVDGIAASQQGRGLGGALLRWAETWARSAGCAAIELWAYEPRIEVYRRMGFKSVEGKQLNLGGNDKYVYMTRALLYNTPEHAALN